MDNKLKACPFCGSLDHLEISRGDIAWVSCYGCHTEGPDGDGESQAIEKWNAASIHSLQSHAATDVLAERRRQINVEGWTEAHDDEHSDRSMALAAACYAMHYVQRAWVFADRRDGADRYQSEKMPNDWPELWAEEWWKPKNPRRDLVRAAALILAEIERLDRDQCKAEA